MKGRYFIAGILFALLWSSASTATKVALQAAQPFTIAVSRFFIAGLIMLVITHWLLRKPMPQRHHWKSITIYALLNISIYLGLYVVSMQYLSAGLGSLAVAINPVFISVIGAILFSHRLQWKHWFSLLLCSAGVAIAAWPLLQTSYATIEGLVLIIASMLAYSAGALFFSKTNWKGLDMLTINAWHTLIGGILLLPVLAFTWKGTLNHLTTASMGGTIWLAIPVSIGAVQLWMWLLRKQPVNAAYWLFLCPVFGFITAALLLKEPLSLYTLVGVILVSGGLYAVQKNKP